MDKKKGNWEKLIDLPEEYSANSDLAAKAIETIQAKQKKPKNWFLKSWKYIAACTATCVLALCIGLPIYNAFREPQIVYYETSEIVYEMVSDPRSFVEEHQLNINYFDFSTAKTQCATIKSTGEFAFLMQDMLYMDDVGFDKVSLKVVLKKNAKFDFYGSFSALDQTVIIQNISVQYGISEVIDVSESNENTFLAKFTYEQIDYYLEITTEREVLEGLELYIDMLIA